MCTSIVLMCHKNEISAHFSRPKNTRKYKFSQWFQASRGMPPIASNEMEGYRYPFTKKKGGPLTEKERYIDYEMFLFQDWDLYIQSPRAPQRILCIGEPCRPWDWPGVGLAQRKWFAKKHNHSSDKRSWIPAGWTRNLEEGNALWLGDSSSTDD